MSLIMFNKGGVLITGGTTIPCPQSISFTPNRETFEFWCPQEEGKQKEYMGTGWTAQAVYFPPSGTTETATLLTALNGTQLLGSTAYPGGTASSNLKITWSAYTTAGFEAAVGGASSATIDYDVDGIVTFGSVS